MECLDLFNEKLPARPYHTDNLSNGLKINKKDKAVLARHIQPNGPTHKIWLVYDVDRRDAGLHWEHVGAPPPNLIARNPANGHAHLLYGLLTPIRTGIDAKTAPLRYAGAIDNAMRSLLDADPGYSGLICKNPLNPHWLINQWEPNLYTLDELADYLDLSPYHDKRKHLPAYGLGRNCTLFEKLREWAYKAIRRGWPTYDQWLNACIDRAIVYNTQFATPLELAEVKHTAKSVAKWTHQRFTPDEFKIVQSARGTKGGLAKGKGKREQGIILLESGATIQYVMQQLNVSRATAYNWKQQA